MKPQLRIIVVSYNSASVLDQFLSSIPEGVRTTVVDNASEDESPSIAGRFGAELIRLESNIGYGAACNTGAAAAKDAELFLFANPDIVFAEGAVEAMLAAAQKYPGAAFNPRIYSGRRRRFRRGSRLVGWKWELGRPMADCVVPVLSGACVLIRRTHFEKVGGFDERIFLFHEDDDLSFRLQKAGVELRLVSDAVIEHSEGGSSARSVEIGRIKGEAMGRSLAYIMRKHGVPFDVDAELRKARVKLFFPHVMFNATRRQKHLAFLRELRAAGPDGARK